MSEANPLPESIPVSDAVELKIDAGNYRGKCEICGTANMDMLTDDACMACEVERLKGALSAQQAEISQILGRALNYPKFSDDQKNFPGATGDDVCVGDRVAESLSEESAKVIVALRERAAKAEQANAELEKRLASEKSDHSDFLAFMAGELAKYHCKCTDDEYASTPPMMWPELIGCIIAKAVENAEARIAALERIARESIEIFERVPVDLACSEDVQRQVRENRAVLEGK